MFDYKLYAVTSYYTALRGYRGLLTVGGAVAPTSGADNALTLLPGTGFSTSQADADTLQCTSGGFAQPTRLLLFCDDDTGSQDAFTYTQSAGSWLSESKVTRWSGGRLGPGFVSCDWCGAGTCTAWASAGATWDVQDRIDRFEVTGVPVSSTTATFRSAEAGTRYGGFAAAPVQWGASSCTPTVSTSTSPSVVASA